MSLVEYTFVDSHSMSYTCYIDTEKFFTSSSQIIYHILNENVQFYYIDSDGYKTNMKLNINDIKTVNKFVETIEANILNNKIPSFILKRQPLDNLKKIEEIIEERKNHIEKYEPVWNPTNLITPEIYKANTKQITDIFLELKSIKRDTELKSFECLKTNWIEIKEHLLKFEEKKIEQYKQKLKETQAKYYQKKKAEIGIKPKRKLTAEEQAEKYKEQLAKANKKYYEKKKSKLLELGVMRPIQTEEEKILARKEANKRYYENMKLRNKVI